MKQSATQHAAEIIQQRIRSGRYPVGEPLLGQRLLAEEFGVGRSAIREAISALEGIGLLQVEPGRGVFVRDPKTVQSARWRFAEQYSVENVYAVRASLESLSVLLATRRATLSEVKILERLTDKLATAVKSSDLLAMSAADRDFHRKLAEMSGNPLLLEMLDAFDVVITECKNLAFQDASAKHRTAPVLEHLQIIKAIKSGDANLACRKMKTHILHAQVRAGLGGSPNK